MNKISLAFALLLSAALLRPAAALDRDALIDHMRESYRIPGSVSVNLGDPKPSEIPGFDVIDVTMSRGSFSQKEKLYLSKDGRHYLLGRFQDLKVNAAQERMAKMDLKGAPSRGPAKAPVLIVQYTDFECPYCQQGYEIMRKRIMKEYPSQVRWVYKSLPLKEIHPWAESAAIAAECVKEQGQDKFWAMHDALFENQRQINMSNLDGKLQAFARLANADMKPFTECYDGKKTLPVVERDLAEAESFGVNGTPAFFVNGHLISGADYDSIKQGVEDALKGGHGKS